MKISVFIFFLLTGIMFAQDSTSSIIDMSKMRTYYLVLLYRGANRGEEKSEATVKLQYAHLQNIARLAKEGKLILAGPFMDDTDLRGMFLLDVKDEAEAIELVATDPAIKAGRLRAEIKPWMSHKGICIVDK